MRAAIAGLVLIAVAATAHDRHVTFAELRHAPDEGVLQVVLDVDSADLDQELAARYEDPPVLETDAADTALVALLADHFVVRDAAGQAAAVTWIGKEIGVDTSSLYFTVDVPSGLAGHTLQQTLGLRFHALQMNTVNVHDGVAMRTLTFTRSARSHRLAVD